MTRPLYRRPRAIGMLASLSILAGLGAVSAMAQDLKIPDYDAIVASPDRSDGDRQADQRRQPARMLAFAGVKTGMKVLRQEIEAAGFKLATEADFLRHPEDPRDATVFRPQIPTDEFVLKYLKPL
jgi:predicted methyltransferase